MLAYPRNLIAIPTLAILALAAMPAHAGGEPRMFAREAYIKPADAAMSMQFGISVAVEGRTLVGGAIFAGIRGGAYVFERNDLNEWVQRAFLQSPNPAVGNGGAAVAISGDTIAVSGRSLSNSYITIFARDAMGQWFFQAELPLPALDGRVIALSGDTLAYTANGQINVYVRDEMGDWNPQQAFRHPAATGGFGNALDIEGDTIVVGDAYFPHTNAGVAYVYARDANGVWSPQATLAASNAGMGDAFGGSVAISHGVIAVGAQGESSGATGVNGDQADNSVELAGAVYVFVPDGMGQWTQHAYIKPSNPGVADLFGAAIDLSGDIMVVGAYQEDGGATGVNGNPFENSIMDSGAAYVFVRDSQGEWSQQAYLKASNPDADDWFGFRLGISGNTIVATSFMEDGGSIGVNGLQNDNSASNAGAVYTYIASGDSDGDGILDAFDQCPFNTPGAEIDSEGRPLHDCNGDCAFDSLDIQCIVANLLGQ
ncbi:MAG TPA: hypothetical protein P5081_09660 [Phycisphaerae bacterium]|nr:hypothetical protein [Phycisphaerae bacterium]HRW53142.1 hypothetical protein [Phycisphaerae bacterium]